MMHATVQMIGLASLVGAEPQAQMVNDAFLDRLERRIELPAGAFALEQYSRSYFLGAGKAKLIGVYSTSGAPGRRWVKEHPGPFIMDGGCAIVTVTVDLGTEKIERAQCNGVG